MDAKQPEVAPLLTKPDPNTLAFTLLFMDGRKLQFSLHKSTSVAQLRSLVRGRIAAEMADLGVTAAHTVRFIAGGRLLSDDGVSLGASGVTDGVTLHCTTALPPPAPKNLEAGTRVAMPPAATAAAAAQEGTVVALPAALGGRSYNQAGSASGGGMDSQLSALEAGREQELIALGILPPGAQLESESFGGGRR